VIEVKGYEPYTFRFGIKKAELPHEQGNPAIHFQDPQLSVPASRRVWLCLFIFMLLSICWIQTKNKQEVCQGR